MPTQIKTVVVSGYFDGGPHSGHLELFKNAKKLGRVLVIVNNDEQSKLKKGYSFYTERERLYRILGCKDVDWAILSVDKDLGVSETLKHVTKYGQQLHIFYNDTYGQCRESDTCRELGIEVIYGDGPKITSSSDLIAEGVDRYLEACL